MQIYLYTCMCKPVHNRIQQIYVCFKALQFATWKMKPILIIQRQILLYSKMELCMHTCEVIWLRRAKIMSPPPSPIQISNFRNETSIKVGSIDSSTLKKQFSIANSKLKKSRRRVNTVWVSHIRWTLTCSSVIDTSSMSYLQQAHYPFTVQRGYILHMFPPHILQIHNHQNTINLTLLLLIFSKWYKKILFEVWHTE